MLDRYSCDESLSLLVGVRFRRLTTPVHAQD